jgi:hypothetical protein
MPRMPGGNDRQERPCPQYRPDAGEPAVWRQNPLRRRVPFASGKRQEALPHARRRTAVRRAERQPECAQAWPVRHGCNRRATADPKITMRSAEAAGTDEVIVFRRDWQSILAIRCVAAARRSSATSPKNHEMSGPLGSVSTRALLSLSRKNFGFENWLKVSPGNYEYDCSLHGETPTARPPIQPGG